MLAGGQLGGKSSFWADVGVKGELPGVAIGEVDGVGAELGSDGKAVYKTGGICGSMPPRLE